MKNFLNTNICLTLLTIQKYLDLTNKKGISKMKDKKEGKINDKFVGSKSKRHSIKNFVGREYDTSKDWILQLSLTNAKTLCLTKK